VRRLPLLLLALAAAELSLLFVIGAHLGGGAVFAGLLVSALAGGVLARREGRKALRAWQQSAVSGEVPSAQLATSAMVVLAGVLLLIPGVLTDVAALLLLVPAVRRALGGRVAVALGQRVRGGLAQSVAARMQGMAGGAPTGMPNPAIIDLDDDDVHEPPR